jgi:hypothetical protein
LQADQFLRERSYPIGVTAAPTNVHPHVAAIVPTQVRKRLNERGDPSASRRIGKTNCCVRSSMSLRRPAQSGPDTGHFEVRNPAAAAAAIGQGYGSGLPGYRPQRAASSSSILRGSVLPVRF